MLQVVSSVRVAIDEVADSAANAIEYPRFWNVWVGNPWKEATPDSRQKSAMSA